MEVSRDYHARDLARGQDANKSVKSNLVNPTDSEAKRRIKTSRNVPYTFLRSSDDPDSGEDDSLVLGAAAGRKVDDLDDWGHSGPSPGCNSGRRNKYLSNWWLELSACILSIAALLALFATLYVYNGRASPDWPTWISINTIVAIYVTVLKAGIATVATQGISQLKWLYLADGSAKPLEDLAIYDNASRGPVGSLSLLLSLKWSHLLSSTGALLIVLVLAADPFAQQILRFVECEAPLGGLQPSIPRTNFFMEVGKNTSVIHLETFLPEMQSALIDGVFNTPSALNVACATGNCTWASEYSSVAMCSRCEDVSDEVTVHYMMNNTSHQRVVTTLNDPRFNYASELNLNVTSGLQNSSQQYAAMGTTPNAGGRTFTAFLLGADVYGNVDPADGKPWSECSDGDSDDWRCRGYGAASCELYVCFQTYRASMQAGAFEEEIVVSSDALLQSNDTSIWAALDLGCLDSGEKDQLQQMGYHFDPDQAWIGYNSSSLSGSNSSLSTEGHSDSFMQQALSRNCLYGIGSASIYSLFFYAYFTLQGVVVGPSLGWKYMQPDSVYTGSQVPLAFFNYGNVTFERVENMFANISLTVTQYMRQHGLSGHSQPAQGVAFEVKTCVQVRFGWLAFPAVLVLLAILFVTLTMFATRPTGGRPEIWKASPLALLYHGLAMAGDEKDVGVETPGNLKGMQLLAKRTKVKLSNPGDQRARLQIVHEDGR